MFVFGSIAIAGLIMLLGGSIFGHDHDVDHDHDGDHDNDHSDNPTVSLFSVKVIGTFVMGFGAGGAIASHYGAEMLAASGIGFGVGLLMGLLMYGVMYLIYGQQATSIVSTENAVGKTGTVTVLISEYGVGEVDLTLQGQHRTYLAISASGKSIDKNSPVKVVRTAGSQLIVEKVTSSTTTAS